MKKLYMLTLACILCCIATSHAQSRYWIGPSNGNWNNSANWSADGINPGASVPNGAGFIVIFDQGAPVVNVDIPSLSLLSMVVTNNVTAKLYTSASTTITASGDGSPNYALRIDDGSRLEDSVSDNVPFVFTIGSTAKVLIDGTWYFGGHPSVTTSPNGPSFQLPGGTAYKVDVNGAVIIGKKAFANTPNSSVSTLFFNAGSEFRIDRDGLITPRATWAETSTIRITGSVTSAPIINGPNNFAIGNLVFNCDGMANEIGWALPLGMTIAGNFEVLNTNNNNLVLAYSFTGPGITPAYVVNKNFQISGNSWVTLGNNSYLFDKASSLQVNGDFVQTGGRFDLRGEAIIAATQPTELKVKGNFTQTAGTFGCASLVTGANLFVVELNGGAPQNIDIASNTIDNTTNQVKLRINNGSGATLLKPLTTGRLEWTGANGVITANGNTLTVNNADAGSVSGAGSNAFVAGGAVTRKTNANAAYSFPTGGTAYRPCVVTPELADPSEYSARYYPNSYSTTANTPPLYKVSNAEYWDIGKPLTSSNASVTLTLAAAVPGAFGPDKIVVAHFNGASWVSAKGTTGTELTPGNATSGSVTSEVLSSFSPFTFGVVPGSPLPVYLVAFNGKKLNNTSAKLDWSITSSSNPDRFEILRSEDGTSFHQVGTVRAAAQQLAFSFVDEQLPKKTAYYQLRMIDQQGVVNMSKIVTIFSNAEGWVINSMMPTLVTSQAKLNISASSRANIRLAVTDMYGRIVHQQQTALSAGSQDVWLNFSKLPAGAYQVTGYLENGQKTSSFRFIKQ